MHLLFLSTFYPPYELGGLDQLCHEVSERLKRRDHHVTVLTSRHGTDGHSDHEVDMLRSLYLQADLNYYRPADFFLKRRQQEQSNAQALHAAIAGNRPDLLVVWNMWNLSRSLPYWAEQWLPGRVAYYVASTWPMDQDIHAAYWNLPGSRRLSELAKRPLRAIASAEMRRDGYPQRLAFAHTACVSRYMRDRLTAAGAIPPTAKILYNGIDPVPFLADPCPKPDTQEQPLRLLYFGSLLPIKGVHVAIEAMGLLKQKRVADRLALTILGRGHPDYVASLTARVTELNLQDNICFRDWVARADLPDMLRQYDVFLFTSTGPEAMARTVMEAMAAGLLVIGSEVGGQVEMLQHQQNALTFKAGNATGLAGCIEQAMNDPDLRIRLAHAGQQTVLERFTLDRMVDEVESWLDGILRENPPL